jgi:hypothetical protein
MGYTKQQLIAKQEKVTRGNNMKNISSYTLLIIIILLFALFIILTWGLTSMQYTNKLNNLHFRIQASEETLDKAYSQLAHLAKTLEAQYGIKIGGDITNLHIDTETTANDETIYAVIGYNTYKASMKDIKELATEKLSWIVPYKNIEICYAFNTPETLKFGFLVINMTNEAKKLTFGVETSVNYHGAIDLHQGNTILQPGEYIFASFTAKFIGSEIYTFRFFYDSYNLDGQYIARSFCDTDYLVFTNS